MTSLDDIAQKPTQNGDVASTTQNGVEKNLAVGEEDDVDSLSLLSDCKSGDASISVPPTLHGNNSENQN